VGLGINFIGYGLSGICRRFLVYPAHCVWPTSLATIALNTSFHEGKVTNIPSTEDEANFVENNIPVWGPFRKLFRMSRMKFFLASFSAMFV
jgi:hypothetical protein